MNEFALITGFHFGRKQSIPPTSELYNNVFGGSDDLKYIDVENALKRAAEEDNDKGEKSLKLALLLFLYEILIVRDRTSKKIDVKYIHLVDDLKKFNNYP